MKTRYRFLHRAGDRYYWENTRRVDSRTELITCDVGWFWGQPSPRAARSMPPGPIRITRDLPRE